MVAFRASRLVWSAICSIASAKVSTSWAASCRWPTSAAPSRIVRATRSRWVDALALASWTSAAADAVARLASWVSPAAVTVSRIPRTRSPSEATASATRSAACCASASAWCALAAICVAASLIASLAAPSSATCLAVLCDASRAGRSMALNESDKASWGARRLRSSPSASRYMVGSPWRTLQSPTSWWP